LDHLLSHSFPTRRSSDLIFVSGYPPIYGTQMLYFRDPILRSRAEIPPPTKFYSIHDGGLSPQDPLPDMVPPRPPPGPRPRRRPRSEEHTSELQSLAYLVC